MFQVLSAPSMGLQVGAEILGLVIAIVLHEMAHAFAALHLGDPTAKYAGRITLNPIKHMDLWGTVLFPLLQLFTTGRVFLAWAKPVPVNYFNLRYGKWGPVIVALAGPAMNFLLVAVFGIAARFALISAPGTALPTLFLAIASINALLMFFNLIPIPPLDGSKILYLFLDRRPDIIHFLERYGMIILLVVLVMGGGLLSSIVFTPADRLVQLFTGI